MNRDDQGGMGRVGKPTGLSQAEPEDGLGPSGFDPSRGDWDRAFNVAMLTLNFSLHHRAQAGKFFADGLNNRAGHLTPYMAARVIAATFAAHQAILLERHAVVQFLRAEAAMARSGQEAVEAGHPDKLYRMGEKDACLLAAVGVENRHHHFRPRDSDGSPKGGDAKQGSVEDDSAGPKDIAQTPAKD